ncbi:MAG: hypothetical protein IJ443_10015, partial [Firmicutes bacterium]|nr:hypothetical protein [Bacillota bacterium]
GDNTGTGTGDSTGTGTGDNTGTGTGDNTGTGTGDSTDTDTDADTDIVVTFDGTVKDLPKNTDLKIRSAPGVDNVEVGTYYEGDRVTILETTVVGKNTWGRTDKGWINLYYFVPDGDTNVEGVVVRVITANSMNVRAEPSTKGKILGSVTRNLVVVVYLQVEDSSGMVWGLTQDGWISLTYTK